MNCGAPGCSSPAVWSIVHRAQIVTVRADSAGEESIRLGAPAPGAHIDAVRFQDMVIDHACQPHVEQVAAGYRAVVDDIIVIHVVNAAELQLVQAPK